MNRGQNIAVAVIAVGVISTASGWVVNRSRNRGPEVRLEEVGRRNLVALVTASGSVRPSRTVDISSDVSARVTQLLVREGDDVRAGQVLLRLDPTQFQAALARARAGFSQAQAQASLQKASLLRAERDHERLENLSSRDSMLVSLQQLQDAATDVEVARASIDAALHGIEQARASVEEADDRLAKTVFRAPMDGKVTRLQIEEGETVIIGTMNNPGSLILTISDLGVVEIVVQVDETNVPELSIGDSALVKIDAFPEATFTGQVTEIGNSAIRPASSQTMTGQQTAVDFEVVITLENPPVTLRPDLSATAEIVVDTRTDVTAIPIIALTVRPASDTLSQASREDNNVPNTAIVVGARPTGPELDGVFRLSGGRASFVPVEVGIAGDEYFEVLSGVEAGDTLVAGPYTAIRQLQAGDRIRRLETPPI